MDKSKKQDFHQNKLLMLNKGHFVVFTIVYLLNFYKPSCKMQVMFPNWQRDLMKNKQDYL